jgi:hypothetical protein
MQQKRSAWEGPVLDPSAAKPSKSIFEVVKAGYNGWFKGMVKTTGPKEVSSVSFPLLENNY